MRLGGRRTGWPGSHGAGSWERGSGSREKCCGAGGFLCSPPARAESRAVMRDGTPGYCVEEEGTSGRLGQSFHSMERRGSPVHRY